MKKIFLIDGDNNINLGLRGIEMLSEDNHVMIFHSKAMEITKFKKKLAGCRAHIDFIESVRSGKNSLDFQITTELGFLSHNKDLEGAYIISCDKGYDAAVDYVKSRYSSKFKELDRRESIFDCFQLAFALKAKTKNELSSALVKEYGPEHGLLVYNHLKSLFGDAEKEVTEEAKADVKLMEKAEKTVAEVQSKVTKTVKKVKTKAKPERKAKPEPVEIIFSADEILVEEEAPNAEHKTKQEVKSTRERGKTRPERKPQAAKARRGSEKSAAVEEKLGAVQETILREGSAKLDAAAEVVVEKVEAVVQKAEAVKQKAEEKVETLKEYDIPLRFGSVRTDEQNQSFYKSKDLRKKTKPQVEAKVEEDHVEAVVEVLNEARRSVEHREERRTSGRERDGQRRSRRTEGERSSSKREPDPEGKVVPMKPRREEMPKQGPAKDESVKDAETKAPVQQKPAETVKPVESTKPAAVKSEAIAVKKETTAKKSSAPAKKASGQNHGGFFGRMFGKKK
ncbi:MAG: hypothetical protein IJ486_09500 [Firmicutes bacterium]|nr:hypothetical protein [Bacillota bacterium]